MLYFNVQAAASPLRWKLRGRWRFPNESSCGKPSGGISNLNNFHLGHSSLFIDIKWNKKHFQMKLAENTRERFLCGKDLNRLETSFVETSINILLSFITSKGQFNTNILILSVPALCYSWRGTVKKILYFHLFQNSLSIKAFSDLSIILEFLRVQKPIIVSKTFLLH